MSRSGTITGGLTGFSLTGYLSLCQKSRFKEKNRTYWFWFDEQSCSLKYYRNMESYLQRVNDSQGCIDLRYAKVTPDITGGETNKSFHISVNNQLYILSAESGTEALNWIEKLQEKRSEYIKMSAAIEENAQEQEKGKRTFQPLNSRLGSFLTSRADRQQEASPPSVRKIISTKLQPTSDRPSVPLDLFQSRSERVILPSPVSPFDEEDGSLKMGIDQRKTLELETRYLESQEEVVRLRKELMKLSSTVDAKDKELSQTSTELSQLKEEMIKVNTPQSDLRLENESLRNVLEQYKRSLRTLDEEINLHKLNQKEHDKRIASERTRLSETEKDLLVVKAKYIKIFSEKFKPVVQGEESADDPGEDRNNAELLSLLKKESGENPVFEGYSVSFEDQHGDIHDWQSGVTTQLYLCRQLFLHYNAHEDDHLVEDWVRYLSQVKRTRGKVHLDLPLFGDRSKKREIRNLLRKGLPIQFRTKIWQSLVDKVIGKTKEVRDSSAGKNTTYYQSLLKSQQENSSEKQIKLDLYRTLPSNTHFKIGGNGAPKLENILLAFSRHNKNIGYCQGMNMVAAVGLLFLDEEMAFWFLIVIIEKLMPPHYYTAGLLASQADQAVVRELVADKLPRLHAHLQRCSIDVTLVTFNWFLTLFVDALPTETVLRILDCFLFEGPKVLFRMSLGILKVNEKKVLSLTDPVALFQFLKEVARHAYDIEALFQAAFVDLNPFPSRSNLSSRHQHHFSIARDQWNIREKQRDALIQKQQIKSQSTLRDLAPTISVASLPKVPEKRTLVWGCGCVRGMEEVWMCWTENQDINFKIIKSNIDEVLEIPINLAGSRVICICYVQCCDMVLLGTLDFFIHAVNCTDHQVLWSLKLNDSILALTSSEQDNTVFAAMADGCVAIIQSIDQSPPEEPPLLLRVGSNAAVQCLSLNTNRGDLWCGCGKAITVMSTESFEVTQSLVMPDIAGKVYKMERGINGVWVSFRASCLLCLYDLDYYVKLLQFDFTSEVPRENLLPVFQERSIKVRSRSRWEYRVTSLAVYDHYLWVGTGSGALYLFSVVARVQNPASHVRALAKQSGGNNQLLESHPESPRERSASVVVDGGLLSSLVADEGITEGHLDHRRKTQFGRTFRGGGWRGSTVKGDSPEIYKLKFEESHQPLSTTNESVKALLVFSTGGIKCLLSCVNDPSNWQNGIQLWRIDDSTGKWSFTSPQPITVLESTSDLV